MPSCTCDRLPCSSTALETDKSLSVYAQTVATLGARALMSLERWDEMPRFLGTCVA